MYHPSISRKKSLSKASLPSKQAVVSALITMLALPTASPVFAREHQLTHLDFQKDAVEHIHSSVAGSKPENRQTLSELETALIAESVEKILAEETVQWSQQEKATLSSILSLKLEATYLKDLVAMSGNDIKQHINNDLALKNASSKLSDDSQYSKVFGTALFVAYLTDIAKSFAIGVLNGTIRSSNINFITLFSALGRNDMRSFNSQLSRSFPNADTFVNAVSTGASFACDSASFGFGSGSFCTRFSSFIYRLFGGYNKETPISIHKEAKESRKQEVSALLCR